MEKFGSVVHREKKRLDRANKGYFRKGTYITCKFNWIDHNAPIFGDKLLLAKVEKSELVGATYQLKLKDLDILVWGNDFERVSLEILKRKRGEERKQYSIDNYERLKFYRTNRNLFLNFGISYEYFLKMRNDQNNLCKICGQPEERRNLSVDHCHKTGKIRGLLCSKCNTALGLFGDNVKSLLSAIEYLKSNEI